MSTQGSPVVFEVFFFICSRVSEGLERNYDWEGFASFGWFTLFASLIWLADQNETKSNGKKNEICTVGTGLNPLADISVKSHLDGWLGLWR